MSRAVPDFAGGNESQHRDILFGQYVLLRRIAVGGMAEIFLAKQTGISGFERLVVVKRILPHLAENREFITMFMDEARIAGQLNHPNVVQIYDVGRVEESCYIAMEYIHGEDVRKIYNQEVQRANRIPFEIAVYLLAQAAHGLDYAHRKADISGAPLGLVHRDVSPQNILVTYDGHVKIVDFGVAKAANKVAQTRSGVLKGKYSYMSPEQAQGMKLDGRTDIFALAVVLYEITCGVRLFKRETELETLQAVITCEIKPPTKIDPDYPPALEAIVLRALSKSPTRRYASASEFARELEDFAHERGSNMGPAEIATYMQELFADHLAEEALVGAGLWDEEHTNENRKAEQRRELMKATATVSESHARQSTRESDQRARHESADSEAPTERQSLGDDLPPAAARSAMSESWSSGSLSSPTRLKPNERNDRAVRPFGALADNPETIPSGSGFGPREPASGTPSFWPIWIAMAMVAVVVGAVTLFLRSGGLASQSFSGPVYFDSHPSGADIFLDGQHVDEGKTPLFLLRKITVGTHEVRFERDGYEPALGMLAAAASGKNTFERDLVAKPAAVAEPPPAPQPETEAVAPAPREHVIHPRRSSEETRPEAKPDTSKASGQLVVSASLPLKVYLGRPPANLLGVTPLNQAVPAGTYLLRAVHEASGHLETKRVTIDPHATVTIEFKVATGHLRVNLQPFGSIKLGTLSAETPLAPIELPVGRYRVKVWNTELGKEEMAPIKISDGQETLLERMWTK